MDPKWIMIIAGTLVALLGVTGISGRQRKNQWLVRLLGDVGFRIFNVVIGVVFIVLAFVLF